MAETLPTNPEEFDWGNCKDCPVAGRFFVAARDKADDAALLDKCSRELTGRESVFRYIYVAGKYIELTREPDLVIEALSSVAEDPSLFWLQCIRLRDQLGYDSKEEFRDLRDMVENCPGPGTVETPEVIIKHCRTPTTPCNFGLIELALVERKSPSG